MIAVDANMLVYAHRQDSAWHQPAARLLRDLAEGNASWGLPWPCVHEFLAIVTHPRIYAPPSTLTQAMNQVDAWMESPSVVLLAEGEAHWETLRRTLVGSRMLGPQIHDARVAALCLQHGITELWTADRDFARIKQLRTRNPLVG